MKEHPTERMDDIKSILRSGKAVSEIIESLKEKSVEVPSWEITQKDYEPTMHRIANDADRGRKKLARIHIAVEQLLTKRMQELMFAIPVKRVYHNIEDSQTRQDISDAIEKIYKHARVDTENLKRSREYFAACEVFTLWYLTESPNNLYGFDSPYKLKCRTFSPMDGSKLYPLFDENDDLLAMSYSYTRKVKDKKTDFFETFTAEERYKWKKPEDSSEWEEVEHEKITIGKIPGIYVNRPQPIWKGLEVLRDNIEYTLSRSSDVVAYNSAPVLKIAGEVIPMQEDPTPAPPTEGENGYVHATNEDNDPTKVFKVENGGDVSYVGWNQGLDATKWHVGYLWSLIHKQAQLPDISSEAMAALGNIGYDARQTLLMDAHLKVGDESGPWIEGFERETNVIKAYLKKMHPQWSQTDIDAVEVEHVITPFILNDEAAEIGKWVTAAGGKPILSQLSAIKNAGLAANAEDELKQIQEEDLQSKMSAMAGMFGDQAAQ